MAAIVSRLQCVNPINSWIGMDGTAVTKTLLLKHQAIGTHTSNYLFIVLDQFHSTLLWL